MRTLSKSDFKLARTCITKLFYREYKYPESTDDNPYLAMLAEGGYMVEQLARLMFPDGVELEYGRDAARDWEITRDALQQDHVTLFEATLLSGRKQARVDILVKRGNQLDLIEVKSKSVDGDELDEGPRGPFRGTRKPYAIRSAWKPYLEDVGYQALVLRELFPAATVTPYLLVVDKSKITTVEGYPAMFSIRRDAEVNGRTRDLDVRFTGDPSVVVPGEFLTVREVSSEVDELLPEIASSAARFSALYHDDAVIREQEPISWKCRACEFRLRDDQQPNGYEECWRELAIPNPHIFDLGYFGLVKVDGEHLGDKLIAAGRTSMYDVPVELLTSRRGARQLVQIRHTREGIHWIGDGLRDALDGIEWPLHFIDFETSMLAVPYHRGMHPYEQVAFQWSCHTLTGPNGVPSHQEWLNTTDSWPNAKFLRSLRDAVGDHGALLTWSQYEETVLRKVRDQLERYGVDDPSLLEWVDGALGRIVDLHAICLEHFFHPDMAGRTSIKVVLDALWKADPAMRDLYRRWTGNEADSRVGPYEGLPSITVAGRTLDVADGTGAMQAYTAMLYGAERDNAEMCEAWRVLLRRYCGLDTLAMVLIWDHWRRITAAEGEGEKVRKRESGAAGSI